MRYLMIISYDGSKFHGFQRQKDVRNVQGYLETQLSKILNEDIIIKGAGRTDALVHARYQAIHFDTNKKIVISKREINQELKDLKIKKIKEVPNTFHARHSVKSKIYLYKIDLKGIKSPQYYGIIKNKLDIKKIKKASKVFLGTHDFRNFVAGNRIVYTTTIKKIKIYKIGSVLYLKFYGYGFYRYMVRNLVGALLEIGKEKIDEALLKSMLDTKELKKTLPTARPEGLYLYKINY